MEPPFPDPVTRNNHAAETGKDGAPPNSAYAPATLNPLARAEEPARRDPFPNPPPTRRAPPPPPEGQGEGTQAPTGCQAVFSSVTASRRVSGSATASA
jgi:hypothetical protein